MKSRETEFLFELLSMAFIEIREDCLDQPKFFALSNLMHNVPGLLNQFYNNTLSHEEVVLEFIECTKHSRYRKWIIANGDEYQDTRIYMELDNT